MFTVIQNLSFTLLGITVDDFECEEKFLSLTSEQCYHIRLLIRRLTYLFRHYHYSIDYPLNNLDKQIIIHLINAIIFFERTYDVLKDLLDLYMKYVHGFSQTKVKHLLYDLLVNGSFEVYAIESAGRLMEFNRFEAKILFVENKNPEDELWLDHEQIRLITHPLYSAEIYRDIFLPMINGDAQEERTVNEILTYLDQVSESEDEPIIDVQEMKMKLTILP